MPSVPGKTFRQTGPTTVSAHGGGDGTFGAAPKPETAKSTTGKTYQEQQNEKNMHSPGSAVKPGQRNPSFAGSAVSKEETKKPAAEKPEKPRRPAEYKTGTPAFLDHPIPMPPPMNYLTGDMDKKVGQMYRDHRRQDIREMPEQLYDTGKPFPNTVKPGQMNGSYTEIPDKEPDNRPYRERIISLQDDLTEEVRQRQWMEQANAEYSQARADALHELNMEDIWAMPIEDREELRKYVDADVERRARMGAAAPLNFMPVTRQPAKPSHRWKKSTANSGRRNWRKPWNGICQKKKLRGSGNTARSWDTETLHRRWGAMFSASPQTRRVL